MLQQPKSVLVSSTCLILRCHSLLLDIGCKLFHHCASRVKNDDSGDKPKNNRENSECHFRLLKSKGQHLLTNARVLDSIVKTSQIKASDTVLEIGPGTGNLTIRLLEACRNVVAVEIDQRMVETLRKRVAEHGFEDRLTLICKDALKTEFPKFDLVVANIPYGISSPLIAKLVFGTCLFRSATLLLQKEFARRLLANPGDSEFNRLAVNVKLVAEVELAMDVSKRDFLPVPKVDSSVVVIRPKAEIPSVDLNEWCAFTRMCFSKKNKTLGATFRQKKKLAELMKISNLMDMGLSEADSMVPHLSDVNHEYKNENENENREDDVGVSGDMNSPCSCLEKRIVLFKEKVITILRSSRFEDKRPSKLSVEELLHLLSLFNLNKICFHDKKDASNAEVASSFDL